jgi:cytochrome c oxidase subunit 2
MRFPFIPERASTVAGQVDALYFFLVGVSVFFSILIAVLVIFFAVKYRRSKHPIPAQIEGSLPLELTWIVIPFILAMVMFVWGATTYFAIQRPPRGALDIYVVGKQWMWKVQHPQGQREINELHVPVGQDVRLTMISQDVIHSFYVPAFRVKMDVLPGRYTTLWFHATKPGRYHLFCAEYCGTLHSGMIGSVVALEPLAYQEWLAGGRRAEGSMTMAESGERLFQSLACDTCHREDTLARGPSLAGLYGSQVRLADGRTIVADDNYLRESILNPRAKIVAGFQPLMPTYQGQVTEEDLVQLVEYIKSLTGPQQNSAAAQPAGETRR